MLRVDLAGARAIGRLAAEGIECVLLKGRGVAERLYDEAWERPYSDIDLLVRADDLTRAERSLTEHGYRRLDRDGDRLGAPGYAHTFADPDGGLIDLHWNLSGVTAASSVTWDVLTERAGSLELGGRSVRVPGDPAIALIVGLHHAHHGAQRAGTRSDLERAIERLGLGDWIAAAESAERLGAREAFTAGLRLSGAGAALADRLGADPAISLEYRLRASPSSYGTWALHRLATARGPGQRLRIVGEILMPSPATMRRFFPLARRGPLGLLGAYLVRPLRLVAAAPPAVREYLKARRGA
jgi:Uncharacterised nucleotidyltransferase